MQVVELIGANQVGPTADYQHLLPCSDEVEHAKFPLLLTTSEFFPRLPLVQYQCITCRGARTSNNFCSCS